MSQIISVHIILIFSYLISHTGIREYVKCFLKLISYEMCFKCLSSLFILRFTFGDIILLFFPQKFLSPCPQPLKIKQDKEVSWETNGIMVWSRKRKEKGAKHDSLPRVLPSAFILKICHLSHVFGPTFPLWSSNLKHVALQSCFNFGAHELIQIHWIQRISLVISNVLRRNGKCSQQFSTDLCERWEVLASQRGYE